MLVFSSDFFFLNMDADGLHPWCFIIQVFYDSLRLNDQVWTKVLLYDIIGIWMVSCAVGASLLVYVKNNNLI